MYEQSVPELVELVYAAACDPGQWPHFLQSLSASLDGSGADLVAYDISRGAHRIHSGVGILGRDFQAGYTSCGSLDPHFTFAKTQGLFTAGTVGLGQQLISPGEFKRTAFYNEFGKRHEYVGGVTGVIMAEGTRGAAVSVCRREGDLFGEAEVRVVRALLPHLRRALQVHARLAETDAREQGLRAALDRLATGAILVSAGGDVLFANNSARQTLAQRDGLTCDRGALRAPYSQDTARLRALIGGALDTAAGTGLASGGVLRLGRPSGRRALHLIVSPLPPGETLVEPHARAIVFLNDPERRPEPDLALLRRVHGLSRAEADVARLLLEDRTVPEIADRLGITANTVRFHLKQLFAKTGTRRQSELVRLLLTTAQVRQR